MQQQVHWATGVRMQTVQYWAIASASDSVYIGGYFSTLNGTTRNRLAAVRGAAGTNLLLLASIQTQITSFAVIMSQDVLLTGGAFATLNGSLRGGFAVYALPSGPQPPIVATGDEIVAQDVDTKTGIYPNPVSTGVANVRLNDKISGRITIIVTDMSGRVTP